MSRSSESWTAMSPRLTAPLQRGNAGQAPRRVAERCARQRAVGYARWIVQRGGSLCEAAGHLGLSLRALSWWRRAWETDRLPVCSRGRPCVCSTPDQKDSVWQLLTQAGPSLGVSSLKARFPQLPRAELGEIKRQFVSEDRQEKTRRMCRLQWLQPGRTWSMDHAVAPSAVLASGSRSILAVRDLASGYQLCWQAVEAEDAAETIRVLQELFNRHGAPLVLKSDNGGGFRASDTKWLLARYGVVPLYSPPATPSYNGSQEASIGWSKTRTQWQAERRGAPGEWTPADLAAATRITNQLSRPWGHRGPTPKTVWHDRLRDDTVVRARFRERVDRHREIVTEELNLDPIDMLNHWQSSARDRVAVCRALVECGLLSFTRRRITPTLDDAHLARIT